MTGPSLTLRRPRIDDAAAVLAAFSSNADMARQGTISTLADAERYLGRLIAADTAHEAWMLAADEVPVGLVCVTVDAESLSGWVSYWMTDSARGRGWMRRAAATVASWALTERGLERLELGHRVNNPASGAVARYAGFVREGTERGKFRIGGERIDVATYGRLRTDPAAPFEPVVMVTHEQQRGGRPACR